MDNDRERLEHLKRCLTAASAHAEDDRPLAYARARRVDADLWRITVHQGGIKRHGFDTGAMEDGGFGFASGHHRLIEHGWEPATFAISDPTRFHGWREQPDGTYTTPLLFD